MSVEVDRFAESFCPPQDVAAHSAVLIDGQILTFQTVPEQRKILFLENMRMLRPFLLWCAHILT